jgi:hypothetical protein
MAADRLSAIHARPPRTLYTRILYLFVPNRDDNSQVAYRVIYRDERRQSDSGVDTPVTYNRITHRRCSGLAFMDN